MRMGDMETKRLQWYATGWRMGKLRDIAGGMKASAADELLLRTLTEVAERRGWKTGEEAAGE